MSRIEQDQDARAVSSLARRFTALVRACGVKGRQDSTAPAEPAAELNAWLTDARACGVSAIETFAAALDADGDAVRAALTQPWSSGQAEGQINRLKLLKRQCYGRAGFGLLPSARSDGGMIHAKRGRTTKAGQSHPRRCSAATTRGIGCWRRS